MLYFTWHVNRCILNRWCVRAVKYIAEGWYSVDCKVTVAEVANIFRKEQYLCTLPYLNKGPGMFLLFLLLMRLVFSVLRNQSLYISGFKCVPRLPHKYWVAQNHYLHNISDYHQSLLTSLLPLQRSLLAQNQYFHGWTMKFMSCKCSFLLKEKRISVNQKKKSWRFLIIFRTNLTFPTTLWILRIQIAILIEKAGAHAMVLCAMKHTAIKCPL